MKKIIAAILCLIPIFSACGAAAGGSAAPEGGVSQSAGSSESAATDTPEAAGSEAASEAVAESSEEASPASGPIVEIDIEDYGKIKLQLNPAEAPKTVENFMSLVKSGFYDGLTFHRIISGFMIQGGDPLGNGTGGSDKEIEGEFESNGHKNNISHKRGVISMARSMDPNSASSQFFIVHQDSTFLDGEYAGFGEVIEGIEVVDAICEKAQPIDENGTIPKEAQPVIKSIKVVSE